MEAVEAAAEAAAAKEVAAAELKGLPGPRPHQRGVAGSGQPLCS